MSFHFYHLDSLTRKLMLDEVQLDISRNCLFISENLTLAGRQDYPNLLRDAIERGNESSLAFSIRSRLNSHEKPRKLKSGEYSKPSIMRKNFHELLAESEFNRFYMRALCLRAADEGVELVVYRAKDARNPRPDSEHKIGSLIQPELLLEDLRSNIGTGTILGLPTGPNSGLSVHLTTLLLP